MAKVEVGTYEVTKRVWCQNCGYDFHDLKIPLGRTIKAHPCPKCKCKKLTS